MASISRNLPPSECSAVPADVHTVPLFNRSLELCQTFRYLHLHLVFFLPTDSMCHSNLAFTECLLCVKHLATCSERTQCKEGVAILGCHCGYRNAVLKGGSKLSSWVCNGPSLLCVQGARSHLTGDITHPTNQSLSFSHSPGRILALQARNKYRARKSYGR